MNIKKQKSSGFTLIELLVVIAIISVLSGVVLQSLNSSRSKSRDASRLATIDQLQKAFELSATLTGKNQLPTTGGTYICLGLVAQGSCGGVASTTINTPLANALSSKVVPYDPKFSSGIGSNFLYNSNVDPVTNPDVTTQGAYLEWSMEATGKCGRGAKATALSDRQPCFLKIGNSI